MSALSCVATDLGIGSIQPAFLERAHFFSSNARASVRDGSNPEATVARVESVGVDQKSCSPEQGDAEKSFLGGVSYVLS